MAPTAISAIVPGLGGEAVEISAVELDRGAVNGALTRLYTFEIAQNTAVSFTPPATIGMVHAFPLSLAFGDPIGAIFSYRADGLGYTELLAKGVTTRFERRRGAPADRADRYHRHRRQADLRRSQRRQDLHREPPFRSAYSCGPCRRRSRLGAVAKRNPPKAGAAAPRKVSFRQFVWLWNRCQGQTTPALHLEIAAWLNQRWEQGDRRLVLLVFRNAGKSTLVGIFCAWLLLHAPDLRILVLAAEHDLARKMVRNVKRIIERHPLTRTLVPQRADHWAADQFTVRRRLTQRDPSLLARGIAANITGSRADVVICDDVEVPNTCATPNRRAELRQRLREVEYILVPGGMQLYVGTPHSYHSIYVDQPREEVGEQAPFLAGYQRLCIPVLDACGRNRWPERFPSDKLDEIRRQTGPAKFESQMLLRPRSSDEVRLDPERLIRYDAALEYREGNGEVTLAIDGRRMVSASGWWDPAYGAPGSGDASVVAAVFVDDDGGYWLHGVRT